MFEVKALREDHNHQTRGVSRIPSEEMDFLGRLEPGLWAAAHGYLCDSSPGNFIGALLAHLHREELQDYYHSHQHVLPRGYQQAIEVVDHYKLYIWNNLRKIYKVVPDQERLDLGPALVKKDCGVEAAVILSGPLAGLISSAHSSRGRKGKFFCVNRVWNDTPLKRWSEVEKKNVYDMPYTVEITHRQWKLEMDAGAEHLIARCFRELVDQYPWASAAFFHLLSEANIPFEREDFHCTRGLD